MLVAGHDIHRVQYRERDRLAIHYHQSYQVRRFRKLVPVVPARAVADSAYPLVHLFDEPQFNTAGRLHRLHARLLPQAAREGRLVFVCLHPTARYHLEILNEIAEQFLLVAGGRASRKPDWRTLVADDAVRAYLGADMTAAAEQLA